MTKINDPEGLRMLIRGTIPGVAEAAVREGKDLEECVKLAAKACHNVWQKVESLNPEHTYKDAHSRGGGGGGGGWKGGGAPKGKSLDDKITFGKHQDRGITWRELVEQDGTKYVEIMLGKCQEDKRNGNASKFTDPDIRFYEAVLEKYGASIERAAPDVQPKQQTMERTYDVDPGDSDILTPF